MSGVIWASQKFKVVSAMLSVKDSDSMNVSEFIAPLWVYTRF